MATYSIEKFILDIEKNPYQALAKLKGYPNLVQKILQSNKDEITKQYVQNIDYILSREDLKNASYAEVAYAIQNVDIKNVNTVFGDDEDWQQKYLDLKQNYDQLQMIYNSKIAEIDQISDERDQLEVEIYALREQLELRGQENKQLANQIEGYMDAANKSLEGVQKMTIRGNNTISKLQSQITQLKMENEQLKIQLKEVERNVKVEEMKRKRHEEAIKTFEPSSASKMYDAGVKKTMSLLEQFNQQNKTNMLRGGAIPMITGNPQNRPMTGGSIPMSSRPIPMSTPLGMRKQNDLREPVLGRGNEPIIEEIENKQKFMIKIGDFSINFVFDPTNMTPEKIRERILPIFNNTFQVNSNALVVPNKQQQPVDILAFMQNTENYKLIFHNWYGNYVGSNYDAIGGRLQEVLNMYKYIFSEIVRQGKQSEFGHALGY